MSTSTAVIIIIGVAIVAAVVVWSILRQRRSKMLRRRFGPEYDRALHEFGNESKAEDVLLARQRRMQKINIHPLSPEECDRFAAQWHDLQTRFVDDPPGSIRAA